MGGHVAVGAQIGVGGRAGVVAQRTERCADLQVVDGLAQRLEEALLRDAPSERNRGEEAPALAADVADELVRSVVAARELGQVLVGVVVLGAECQTHAAVGVAAAADRLVGGRRGVVQFGQLLEGDVLAAGGELVGLVVARLQQRQQADVMLLGEGIVVGDAGLRGDAAPLRVAFGQVVGLLAGADVGVVARVGSLAVGDVLGVGVGDAGSHDEVGRGEDLGRGGRTVVRTHDLQPESLDPRQIPLQRGIGLDGDGLRLRIARQLGRGHGVDRVAVVVLAGGGQSVVGQRQIGVRVGGLLGDREPRSGRYLRAGGAAGGEARGVAVADLTGDAQREGEVVGDLRFEVRTDVVAVVVEVLDVTLLVHVAQRCEIVEAFAAAGRGDTVLLGGAGAEDLVEPVGVAPAAFALLHHGDVLRGEDGILAVQLERLVVPIGVARTVEELGIGGVERGAVRTFVGERHGALLALLGRHDHDAAGTLQTVDRHGRAVLEQRDRLDVVGVDVVDRTRNAVDDVEDSRLGAADGHRGLVLARLSRALQRDQTGHAACETLRDIGHGHLLQLLAVHLRYGGRDVGAALVAVADHHHLVQAGGILLKRDVERGDTPPHDRLVRCHADEGEDQRTAFRYVDHVVALGIGGRALVGAFDHDGHADKRIAAFVGYRTPDGRLCQGCALTGQQQSQCHQTRPHCRGIPEIREKLFHRIAFKLVY